MGWKLVFEKGPLKGEMIKLEGDGIVAAGRRSSNKIQLNDELCSREHCRFHSREGRIFVEDLKSRHGTHVNYERVEKAELKEGDLIQLGNTEIWLLTTEPDPYLGKTIEGYMFHFLMGRGSEGIVYLAEQMKLNRTVAVKVLNPNSSNLSNNREKFLKEATIAARLSHPNLVGVYDVIEKEDIVFFSMEHMGGGSLDDRIANEGKISPSETVRYLKMACAGLTYLHGSGLVHRDIKPANFMLDDNDTLKIGDFGIVSDGGAEDKIKGSPYFIAPEQIQGKPVDARSDLYALGCSAFKMLSGEPMFKGKTMQDVLLGHINTPPTPFKEAAKGIPVKLATILNTLVNKDPNQRYADAAALSADLDKVKFTKKKFTKKKGTAKRTKGGGPKIRFKRKL